VSSSKLRFDGWILDPESGDLERGGARIRLQEQPVQVLRELIAHAGSVVPREQLIALLWPKGVVDFDTGLNTVIRKLRSALGDTSETPRYIETLPRRGYRFIGALDPNPEAASGASAAVQVSTPSGASLGLAPPLHQEPTVLPEADLGAPRPMPSGHEPAARDEATSATAMTIAPVRRPRLPALALIAALAVAALLTGVYALWRARSGASVTGVRVEAPSQSRLPANVAPSSVVTFSPPPHSIAVLPFVDMSEKKDQEYFSDGLSEELIDMLTKIPGLSVPARTSSFYFKGKSEDIQTIAKRLMVAHVLEGSVRKAGKHVRITAQLIRTDNGYHVWSETYDRQLDDIFKIQDEIASAVAHALEASLAENSVPRTGTTHNTDAYQLYLQAQFIHQRASTPEDFRHITGLLEQSLKMDPDFAPAWAYLSSMLLATCGSVGCQETVEAARRAADRALALDPTLPSAHTALAKIRLLYEWDWRGAQSEAKRALELDPGNVNALAWSGYVAWALGDMETALDFLQREAALDPLSPHSWLYLAIAFIQSGRLEDAQTSLHNAGDLNPNEGALHRIAAEIMLRKGQPNAALTEIGLESDEENRTYLRACAYHALSKRNEADAALANLQNKFANEAAGDVASVYAFRGDLDQGFRWLDRAYKQHEVGLTWVKVDVGLKNLWPDPRWKAFLRKMKLPE
jgi:TolB-like protein/DNA-binding winged helix-turn-helix (wHTH) protein/cytochrome c-type biogenesis protein CcmH/NrfG